jgi:hypothetical protein
MTFLFLDPCARDVLERLDRASFSFLGGILEAFVRAGDDFRDSARRSDAMAGAKEGVGSGIIEQCNYFVHCALRWNL